MSKPLNSEQVTEVILSAVRFVNEQLPSDQKLTASPNLVLVGELGTLDSLQFVNFVLSVEQKMASEMGIQIILTDSEVLSNQKTIFATVRTLADYIVSQVQGKD